jgi:hypothetical protein
MMESGRCGRTGNMWKMKQEIRKQERKKIKI